MSWRDVIWDRGGCDGAHKKAEDRRGQGERSPKLAGLRNREARAMSQSSTPITSNMYDISWDSL